MAIADRAPAEDIAEATMTAANIAPELERLRQHLDRLAFSTEPEALPGHAHAAARSAEIVAGLAHDVAALARSVARKLERIDAA